MRRKIFFYLFFNFSIFGNQIEFLEKKIDLLNLIIQSENLKSKNLYIQNQNIDPSVLLFYLDCEAKSADFLIDKAGNFSFLKKEIKFYRYSENSNEYFTSKKEIACSFRKRKDRILIETKSEQWFDSIYHNLESNKQFEFSLSFWFYPFTLNLKEQNLFLWNSFINQENKEFKIYIEQGNLKLKLKNVLYKGSTPINIEEILIKKKELEQANWYHIFLAFSPKENQILVFFNGKNHKIILLPENTYFDFFDWSHPPLQLGGDYLGLMDEFYIFNKFYNFPITFYNYPPITLNITSGRTNLNPITYSTPVIYLPNDTKSIEVFIQYSLGEGTLLKIEYNTFDQALNHNEWKEFFIGKSQNIYQKKLERFIDLKQKIQFRITLLHDSNGIFSPIIQKFELKKVNFEPLEAPKNLRIVSELSNKEQVCLEWQKLPNEEIETKGGYKIHIGINNKNYSFVLDKILVDKEWKKIIKKNTDFPLTEKEKEYFNNRKTYWEQYKRNHIRVIIKKEDILQYYDTFIENHLSKNRIPLIFEKDRIYYFAVSSYLYSDIVKSEFSNSVSIQF